MREHSVAAPAPHGRGPAGRRAATDTPGVTHKYGNMYSCMKTTIELPDELFVAAKQTAARDRTTLRAMVERGLRSQLAPQKPAASSRKSIRWVTVKGGLPGDVDLTDRAAMHEWLRRTR